MSIEDPSRGRFPDRESARWPDPPPPAPLPPLRQDSQPAQIFPPAAGPLPPRPQPLQQQELSPPLPHWETPQQVAMEAWPPSAGEAQPVPLQTEPPSPHARIPNLLIERQLRVISTSEHPVEMGQGTAAPAPQHYHNQHYHYSEAYSQGYSDPVANGFGLPFPPRERSGEAAPAAAANPHQAPVPATAAASSPDPIDVQQQRIQQLEKELEAAQDEVQALSEMLDELPTIFERKFQQRLQGVLDQQRLLMAENSSLRDRLFGLLPGASTDQAASRQLLLPPVAPRPRTRLGDRLRRALGWRSRQESQVQGRPAGQEDLSRPDDGRPRVA